MYSQRTSLGWNATAVVRKWQPADCRDFLSAPKKFRKIHAEWERSHSSESLPCAQIREKSEHGHRISAYKGTGLASFSWGCIFLRTLGSMSVSGILIQIPDSLQLLCKLRRGKASGGGRRHLQRPRGLQPLERDLLWAFAGIRSVDRIVRNRGAGTAPPFANSICVHISGPRHVWCWQKFSHFGKMLARNENCRVRQNAGGTKGADERGGWAVV